MNGYKILADAHRKAGQEHKAALFDFLGECTQEDINTINSEQAEAIRARHAGLFDEMQAAQVLK